jgi:extradiol dioxygenase family protein
VAEAVLGVAHCRQQLVTLADVCLDPLAVADVVEAKAELDRTGTPYWSLNGATGPGSEQLFLRDPHGNMIELHQVDRCRCRAANRS